MMGDPQKRQEILEVLNYRDGPYYVGSLATCHVVHLLGGTYGLNMNLKKLVKDASVSTIWKVNKYLASNIKHMREHPVSKCPCCGSLVRKTQLQ